MSRNLKLTLADGEIVNGRPNYVDQTHAEIRTPDGLRWIERATIEKTEHAPKGDR